jgi:hypothetical protein
MIYRLLPVILLILLLFHCTTTTIAGGSDSPDFRVIGKIEDIDGTPLKNAIVVILPESYNPVTDGPPPVQMLDTTDSNGVYSLGVNNRGMYTVSASDPVKKTKLLLSDIPVALDSLITVAPGRIAPCGSISVTLPTTEYAGVKSYIYIPGTRIYLFCNEQGEELLLDSVPQGVVPQIAFSSLNPAIQTKVLRYNVPVMSNITTNVRHTEWNRSKDIVLNTSSDGANVPGTVTNVPVLIRLTGDNFDFASTHAGGSDLMFTKSDATPLPCYIERFDSTAQRADIWVNVDTIHGNSKTQRLYMYWDNTSNDKPTYSKEVFDTSYGFAGVWHMSENTSSVNVLQDCTPNGYHAQINGITIPYGSTNGMVGGAMRLDGVDDYIDAGNVDAGQNYSISAWVKIDTSGIAQRFIFKDSSYTLWFDNRDTAGIRVEHMTNSTWWRGIRQDGGAYVPMLRDTWYHLLGTYDGSVVRLYVNGVEVSRSNPIDLPPVNTTTSLVFGRYRDSDYVNGIIDELRIERIARSADWILLNYMNQRSDNKLVQIQ